LLYYHDNPETQDSSIVASITEDVDIENLEAMCTCFGSYMFNIDKEGAALGFEYDGIDEPVVNAETGTFDVIECAVEDYFIKDYEFINNQNIVLSFED
jgi:hypothetical protein